MASRNRAWLWEATSYQQAGKPEPSVLGVHLRYCKLSGGGKAACPSIRHEIVLVEQLDSRVGQH